MHKIGIVGNKDSILGFKALGVQVFPVDEAGDVENTLKTMVDDGFSLIYVTEKAAQKAEAFIHDHRGSVLPIIISVPDHSGSLGLGMQSLKETTIKAIGADILFKEETPPQEGRDKT
jgi:V/A-type H+-transporting ATPase subunit F